MDFNEIWEDVSNSKTSTINNENNTNNINIDIVNQIVYINKNNYSEYFTSSGNSNVNIQEYRLEENITISENIFIRLYDGVIFNGQGNIITINNSSFLGLFYLSGGTIMNLNIQKGSSKLVKGNGIGWLVRINSKGKIMNCSCVMNVAHNVAYYSAERGNKLTGMTYLDRIDYIVMK
jgi:hypothetical protein